MATTQTFFQFIYANDEAVETSNLIWVNTSESLTSSWCVSWVAYQQHFVSNQFLHGRKVNLINISCRVVFVCSVVRTSTVMDHQTVDCVFTAEFQLSSHRSLITLSDNSWAHSSLSWIAIRWAVRRTSCLNQYHDVSFTFISRAEACVALSLENSLSVKSRFYNCVLIHVVVQLVSMNFSHVAYRMRRMLNLSTQ